MYTITLRQQQHTPPPSERDTVPTKIVPPQTRATHEYTFTASFHSAILAESDCSKMTTQAERHNSCECVHADWQQ